MLHLINSTVKGTPPNSKLLPLGPPFLVFGPDSSFDIYFSDSDKRFSFYMTMIEIMIKNDLANEYAMKNGLVEAISTVVCRVQSDSQISI